MTGRTIGSRLGDWGLTLAAVAGALSILGVVLALVFNLSLIMFKTGSMAPTIPTGSLAVVREMPASQVRVGEVVTVDRPGQLPITHRVVSVTGTGTERTIVMKGDANPTDDPSPYHVRTVRLVLFSVPRLAYVVVWFSNPFVLGGITVGVAALVTWAFWPRDGQRADDRGHPGDRAGRRRAREGPGGRRGSRAGAASVAVLLASALATAGAFGTPERASAASPVARQTTMGVSRAATSSGPREMSVSEADSTTVVAGKYLTLVSSGDLSAMQQLTPGQPAYWEVGVSAHPPEPGTVSIGLSGTGPLLTPDGLQIAVEVCAQPWSGTSCPAGASRLLPVEPASEAVVPLGPEGAHTLLTTSTSVRSWLLISADVPDDSSRGRSAELIVHAWASGEEIATGSSAHVPESALATTGSDLAVPALAALCALAAGIAVSAMAVLVRRVRRPAAPASAEDRR